MFQIDRKENVVSCNLKTRLFLFRFAHLPLKSCKNSSEDKNFTKQFTSTIGIPSFLLSKAVMVYCLCREAWPPAAFTYCLVPGHHREQ